MCRELLETRKASIEAADAARLEAASATVFGDYWKAAFAPSGIPNMVLQQNIPALNALAGQVSQELTGGVLKVEFSGEVGLASGDTRNKLNIKASNRYGGPKVEGSSKGETGLINIVLAETLARIGGIADRIKWRWFDETINAQDPVVRSNILTWLRTRSEGGLVFLVDHHAEVENYATHRLVAEKSQSGVTEYHWE
jgi:DNA repair exonuclease SbcCD ATPase subunit